MSWQRPPPPPPPPPAPRPPYIAGTHPNVPGFTFPLATVTTTAVGAQPTYINGSHPNISGFTFLLGTVTATTTAPDPTYTDHAHPDLLNFTLPLAAAAPREEEVQTVNVPDPQGIWNRQGFELVGTHQSLGFTQPLFPAK